MDNSFNVEMSYSFAHIKSLAGKKPVRRMSSPEMLPFITNSGIKSQEYDEFNRFFWVKKVSPHILILKLEHGLLLLVTGTEQLPPVIRKRINHQIGICNM